MDWMLCRPVFKWNDCPKISIYFVQNSSKRKLYRLLVPWTVLNLIQKILLKYTKQFGLPTALDC
jgi:hypothetical protein